MTNISRYATIVEEKIATWLQSLAADPLYDPVRYIMRPGGKRLRPALVLMANEMFGGNVDDAIAPALSVELFHNFTLMHDDIMDEAPTRRGEDTVHVKWDTNTAILSGDALFALAYKALSDSQTPNAMAMWRTFNNAALIVCEGQEEDMRFEQRDDVSVQQYLDMIGKKTAALLAASLQLGAMSAGVEGPDLDAMHDLGWAMGIAFQLQDDLLDAYADPKDLGKRKGGDIIADKKTFLLLSALEKANADQRRTIEAAKDLPWEQKVSAVLSVFDELEIRKSTQGMMSTYYTKASGLLDSLAVDAVHKESLRSILDLLAVRVS